MRPLLPRDHPPGPAFAATPSIRRRCLSQPAAPPAIGVPSPLSACPLRRDSASLAGQIAPKAPPCPHAGEHGHSMSVRLKFLRPGSPRMTAAIEPFPGALLGALHEMTRCREIVWRNVERTERRFVTRLFESCPAIALQFH